MLQPDSKQVTQQTAAATPVCKNLCYYSSVISQFRSRVIVLIRVELRKPKEASQLKSKIKAFLSETLKISLLYNWNVI
jgi:hypothetical protein